MKEYKYRINLQLFADAGTSVNITTNGTTGTVNAYTGAYDTSKTTTHSMSATMKEYYDIFMSGLFIEDREGHYVCHVDDLKQHIKPPTARVSPQRNRQVRIERILEDLEEI